LFRCICPTATRCRPTADERLLGDAMDDDATLFARQDSVAAVWEAVERVLDDATAVLPYEPGT
jgi:glucose-6-phosphate 1-dehydrogenase